MPPKVNPKRIEQVRQAAALLANLPILQQQRILAEMAKKDLVLTRLIEENMVCLEDLRHLTATMLVELLQEIRPEVLALALRLVDRSLQEHLLGRVSKGLQKDMKNILFGPPREAQAVQKAADEVLTLMRKKVAKGEIVIRPQVMVD